MALACFFIFAGLFAFLLRSSERLIQRERVRARTDATAFSASIAYARGLNVLAATQKGVAIGWVAALFDGGETKDYIQKIQAGILKVGPWLNALVAENVGFENGLLVLPVWNQGTLFQGLNSDDLVPSYNVRPSSLSDAAAKALASKASPGIDHYEYRRKDGSVVILNPDQAGPVEESDGRGGRVIRHKAGPEQKYRYVKAVPGTSTGSQLSLEEGRPHMVTLLAWQPAAMAPRGRSAIPVFAFSQAQVAGGSQSLVDPDGSSYGATLVPVQLFADDVLAPEDGSLPPQESLGLARDALQALPVDPTSAQSADAALAMIQSLFEIRH